MHIPEGLLSPQICAAGYTLSLSVLIISLRRSALVKQMTRISLVAAVLFVSSLIHIPVGFTTVHFTLAGLAGILLGPLSFLAVCIAVFLQWLLLFHGGLTTLGVNAFTMGTAALAAYAVFHFVGKRMAQKGSSLLYVAVAAGIISSLVKISLGSGFLVAGGYPAETFTLLLTFHLPIIVGEGVIAGLAARYLLKFTMPEYNITWKKQKIRKFAELKGHLR